MPKQKFDRMEMVALWNRYKGNESEVARRLGVTRRAVREARKVLPDEYFVVDLEHFRQERANIFATIQRLAGAEILRKLTTPGEAKKISPQQLVVLLGTMYDKERLEQGKATEHIAHQHWERLATVDRDLIKELIKKRTQAKLDAIDYGREEVVHTQDSTTQEQNPFNDNTSEEEG